MMSQKCGFLIVTKAQFVFIGKFVQDKGNAPYQAAQVLLSVFGKKAVSIDDSIRKELDTVIEEFKHGNQYGLQLMLSLCESIANDVDETYFGIAADSIPFVSIRQ